MTLTDEIEELCGMLAAQYPDGPVPTKEFQLVLGLINSDPSYINKPMHNSTLSHHISRCRKKPVLDRKGLGLERVFSGSKKYFNSLYII